MITNQKSIFQSKIFWVAVVNAWLGLSPNLSAVFMGDKPWFVGLVESLDNFAISSAIVLLRYNPRSELYTPKGLPGRDRSFKVSSPQRDRQN